MGSFIKLNMKRLKVSLSSFDSVERKCFVKLKSFTKGGSSDMFTIFVSLLLAGRVFVSDISEVRRPFPPMYYVSRAFLFDFMITAFDSSVFTCSFFLQVDNLVKELLSRLSQFNIRPNSNPHRRFFLFLIK